MGSYKWGITDIGGRITPLMTILAPGTLLITPLSTTHEPPSSAPTSAASLVLLPSTTDDNMLLRFGVLGFGMFGFRA